MTRRIQAVVEYCAALALVAAVLFSALSVWEPVRVAGRSMSPALHPGDLVIVRKGARPHEGDIALVRARGHGAVLHRVVAVGGDGDIKTRGDANEVADRGRTSAGEVAGVAVRVIPAGELLLRWRGAE